MIYLLAAILIMAGLAVFAFAVTLFLLVLRGIWVMLRDNWIEIGK